MREYGWAAQFVGTMREERAAGAGFEEAYKFARRTHGVDPRTLGGFPQSLTDPDPEAWWKGVCWDAWHNAPSVTGGPSRLYLLPGVVDAMRSSVDESKPARRVGYRKAAA